MSRLSLSFVKTTPTSKLNASVYSKNDRVTLRDGRDDRVTTSAIGAGRVFFSRDIVRKNLRRSNGVKDQAEPGRDSRRLYYLLTASQVAFDRWNVTSADTCATQVHRHTRRALARKHTRAMRYLLRIRFDEEDALQLHGVARTCVVDSSSGGRVTLRAVRHPALDWLLCLVNRNS